MGTLDELLDRKRMDLGITVAKLPQDLITKLGNIATVRTDPDGITSITIQESREAPVAGHPGELRRILEILEDAGFPLKGIKSQETSLETLFLSLTGRTLRD